MIVSEQSARGRGLRGFAVGVHLESGAGGGAEAFDEQTGIFAEEEAAVADGGEPFGSVGDGGVEAVTNFADGGVAGVGDRSLRDARVVGYGLGESGNWKSPCDGVKSAEAVSIREKLSAGEWSDGIHGISP